MTGQVAIQTLRNLDAELSRLEDDRREAEEILPYAEAEHDEDRVIEALHEIEALDLVIPSLRDILRRAKAKAEADPTGEADMLPDGDIPF